MSFRLGPATLGVALLAAAGLALFQHSSSARLTSDVNTTQSEPAPPGGEALDDRADPHGSAEALPPNHPPIHSGRATHADLAPASNEAAVIAWTAPPAWQVVPNASPIRLMTYRLPNVATDPHLEMTVTRAGGTAEANLDRWVGQFDAAGPDLRAERVVDGIQIKTVEVSGTYEGGMTMGGSEEPHPGWALIGAVVETSGSPYFFKLVGPLAAVKAARPLFDRLLNSIHKTP